MKVVSTNKVLEGLFTAIKDNFLACFGSYVFAKSVKELAILRKYFSTSLDNNSFHLSKVPKSLRLA